MNSKKEKPSAVFAWVATICSTTASTTVGVEISSRATKEKPRSTQEYCRTAVQAPRATPPTMPRMVPMVTSRSETHTLVPISSLMDSPLGVIPQSQWETMPSQRT